MGTYGESSALVAAVIWIEQTLSGTVAILLATIAICSVGFLMQMGRIELKRGIAVVLGCFVIFGASSIAQGFMAAIREEATAPVAEATPPPVPIYPQASDMPASAQASPGSGPYASASQIPK